MTSELLSTETHGDVHWASFRYRTFVSEDAGPNTLVATVLAKDPDGDGITYKITVGNEEGNFVIDSQKGKTCSAFHPSLDRFLLLLFGFSDSFCAPQAREALMTNSVVSITVFLVGLWLCFSFCFLHQTTV